jgi:hypothetical protein
LAAVATSGDYDDLINTPTIPTATSDLTNDGEDGINPFITAADVTAQVNSDWDATSGVAEIFNKPTIPAAVTKTSDLTNDGSDGVHPFITAADVPAAVTSVGLTMPSAFSVANSPITSAGTLAVTGAGVVSQYVRGDGSLANFPTSTGGGASLSFYLNGSVSQGTFGGVAFKEMDRTPILGAGTDFTINANGYIQSFITDANVPNLLEIPAGNWNFETYFSASSSGGSPSFYVELYKWNGATLSLIASNSATPEGITNGTAIDLYVSALAVPQTTLLATDRLAVRIYVTHSGRTITLHTENSHLCEVITTFSTGITALNGLTAQVQSFATGTSGTDFAISSATATHTFNLPTASAANRGALSSTDWNTFNNKFTLPALTSGSVLFSNGTTIAQDNSNLFWDDTNNRLGIGTATPSYTLQFSNHIGASTLSAFGLNYLLFNAITSNQGISVGFSPNGTPTSYAYNFQFNKSSTANNNSLLFIGGGSSASGNSTNKHVISTSCDGGATGQPLVLRVAPSSVNFGSVNDHLTIFPTGNVVIQNASASATDAGFKLDVNGTARVSGQLTLGGSVNLSADSTLSIGNATSRILGFFVRSISSGANTLDVLAPSHNFADTSSNIRLKIFGSTGNVQVQNGGTYTDIASARLAVNSTTQGFLPPRMTNAQRLAIATPAVGLIVYCTDVVEGLYINKSTGWTFII